MSMEAAVFAILSGARSTAGSRFYPGRMPDTPTFPLGVYQWIDGVRVQTRDNQTGTNAPGTVTPYSANGELQRRRLQIDLMGQTYEQVRVLEAEITPYIDGFNGTAAGETISRMWIDNARDDPFDTGGETYRRVLDVILWHK